MKKEYEVDWNNWLNDTSLTEEEKTIISGHTMNLWKDPLYDEINKLYSVLDQIREISSDLLENNFYEERLHKIYDLCHKILNKPY